MVPWNCPLSMGQAAKLGQKDIGEGLILNEGPELRPMALFEYGHLGLLGLAGGTCYDPTDLESRQATVQAGIERSRLALEKYKSNGIPAQGDASHNMLGPQLSNYHLWLRKVKRALDPNVASDPSAYITPKE